MRLFVTATGTEIGKTHLCCALLRHLPGLSALKPVVSGFDPARPEAGDPALLLAAMGRAADAAAIAAIAPFRYRAPLSPEAAAAREGRPIDYAGLLGFCRAAPSPVLIEGVGGVMTPLDAGRTVLDWIDDLGMAVLLVAGSYLGAQSHTLSALAVLRARKAKVVAVAVNETPGSTVALEETVAAIVRHGAVDVRPVGRPDAPDQVAALAALLTASAGSR